VGLIQRAIETAGIATISITLSVEITRKIRPARALWPGFPLGHPLGYPHQADRQLQVLRTMLKLLEELESPGAIIKKNMTSNWVNVSARLPRLNRGINNGRNINL
jgi:D-proline reductase (dithiol) PrdB